METVAIKKISSSKELQDFFRDAQERNAPVTLYRKSTSDGIALDFNEWNGIEVFDVDNLMVIVSPGIQMKELNSVALEKGLRFIPADSPGYSSLSVGEWAYRGCPNPSSWKYGAGKHFLLGSTYVFPNGEITSVGGKCIKNVTGYDFTRFLSGAYSDLAVGVQYIIKLMPQPECRYRYDVTVNSLAEAIRLVGELQNRSVPPAWLFWADEVAGSKLFGQEQKGHRILFELDGNEAEVNNYKAAVDNMLAACKNDQHSPAESMPDMSGLEFSSSEFWLLDEYKIPYSAVDSFAIKFTQKLSEHGLRGGIFGQLADGKIHVYIEKAQSSAIEKFLDALNVETFSLGGSVCGKYSRLYGINRSNPMISLEQAFRKKIDPNLIFNQLTEVAR